MLNKCRVITVSGVSGSLPIIITDQGQGTLNELMAWNTGENWWVSSSIEASVIITDWVLNHSRTNVSWYYFPQRGGEAISSNHRINNNLWLLSGHGVTDLPGHLSICLSLCLFILLLYLHDLLSPLLFVGFPQSWKESCNSWKTTHNLPVNNKNTQIMHMWLPYCW